MDFSPSFPHQRLDLVNFFGGGGGQYLIAVVRDQHVVLDTHADPLPAFVQFGFQMNPQPRPMGGERFGLDQEFGEPRILQALQASPGGSAEQTLKNLLAAVDAFTGVTRQHDDITLLVLRAT